MTLPPSRDVSSRNVKASPKSARRWVTGNNLAGTIVEQPGEKVVRYPIKRYRRISLSSEKVVCISMIGGSEMTQNENFLVAPLVLSLAVKCFSPIFSLRKLEMFYC